MDDRSLPVDAKNRFVNKELQGLRMFPFLTAPVVRKADWEVLRVDVCHQTGSKSSLSQELSYIHTNYFESWIYVVTYIPVMRHAYAFDLLPRRTPFSLKHWSIIDECVSDRDLHHRPTGISA